MVVGSCMREAISDEACALTFIDFRTLAMNCLSSIILPPPFFSCFFPFCFAGVLSMCRFGWERHRPPALRSTNNSSCLRRSAPGLFICFQFVFLFIYYITAFLLFHLLFLFSFLSLPFLFVVRFFSLLSLSVFHVSLTAQFQKYVNIFLIFFLLPFCFVFLFVVASSFVFALSSSFQFFCSASFPFLFACIPFLIFFRLNFVLCLSQALYAD